MKNQPENFLFRQKQLLTIMGHSLDFNKNKKESVLKQIRQYSVIILVVSCFYPITSFIIYDGNNIDKLTAGLSIVLIVILNTIKMTTFLVNKSLFLNVMNQLKEMWKHNTSYSNAFAKKRLKDVNTLADRMVNSYFYVMMWSSVYFLFSPFASLAWSLVTHRPITRRWIAPMRFFFDADSSPGFEIASSYIICVSLPVVFNLIAIDGLFVSFTANICAHFGLLQQFIETNEFTENYSRINNDIRSFVKYHIVIFDVATNMYEAYKPIIFGQFLMTSLQVCVIVYQISRNMDNIIVLVYNICFLSTVLTQLLIYCYGGEKIKLESMNVNTSVQLTKWYRLHPNHRKMMSLIMLRSQKPFIMRVGFYDASLASFMLIIKAASSYITLIQSLE